MQRLEVLIKSLVLSVTSSPERPLRADYLSDSRVVVIRTPFPDALEISQGEQVLVLDIREVEIRLSEESLRQLAEKLPPELLH